MDRDRLRDVHKTDLKESRVNEDFVVWLKTKGPSWLLIILVGVVAYLFMVRWRQAEVDEQNAAWIAMADANLPASMELVAQEYAQYSGVADLARIRAASGYLNAVVSGQALGSTTIAPEALAEDDRIAHLDRADGIYAALIAEDDGSQEGTLVAVIAYNGRAAVAECRGDLEAATASYEQAASRAHDVYPVLAERSRSRAATVGDYTALPNLIDAATLGAANLERIRRDEGLLPFDPATLTPGTDPGTDLGTDLGAAPTPADPVSPTTDAPTDPADEPPAAEGESEPEATTPGGDGSAPDEPAEPAPTP